MKRIDQGSGKGASRASTGKSRLVIGKARRVSELSKQGTASVYNIGSKAVAPDKVDAQDTVLLGSFDKNTGLTILTDRRTDRPDATAQFEVIKSGRHVYQLKTDALKCLNFTDEEIYTLVVPKRTLARRVASDEPLSVEETDKAVRLGRIDKLAVDVFGDASKAHRWLRKPKGSLGGEPPLACLSSEAGARAVEEMLNQIDHGITP